jgi:hypothetical protein
MIFINMKNVKITCDRCGSEIEGMIGKCPDTGAITTSGYYIVAEGSSWNEYQRDDEEYVCDDCMHADPQYKKLYLQE